MVCSRCILAVKKILADVGLEALSIELGEVALAGTPSKKQLIQLSAMLKAIGFELIDSRKNQTIEKIKTAIISLVHHNDAELQTNLSEHISASLHQDYNYLSNLFSAVEGISIEKYYILHRIEKVKELLVYDQLSLSQIADQLGYSSVAYLSNQFKKLTGLTPSYFKTLKDHKRTNIEDL
ncbi:MAG: AraC family transcriptional regulator [Ferruginibacter sp.]|nr:AraC family transcriptional regulator [Ferruginibacter sp.]